MILIQQHLIDNQMKILNRKLEIGYKVRLVYRNVASCLHEYIIRLVLGKEQMDKLRQSSLMLIKMILLPNVCINDASQYYLPNEMFIFYF